MGGRGSSTGVSDHGIPYGREYHSLLTVGNIKFVVKLSGSTTAPMETMTKGRVYVTISPKGELKFISYYDNKNRRSKQIDFEVAHNGILPHTHHGYNHNEFDGKKGCCKLTTKEKAMLNRVIRSWNDKKDDVWTRWLRR